MLAVNCPYYRSRDFQIGHAPLPNAAPAPPCSARSAAFRSPPAHRPTAPCLAIPMSTDTATPVPRYRPYVAAFHDSTPQAMATLAPTPPRRTAGGVRSAGEDHTRAAASTSAADAERMETVELISELAAVFRSTEDVELIDALAALDAQVRQTGEQRSAALKQTLRALSTRVEQARERATPTEPEDAHAQRLEGREREKQQVIAQIMTAEENTRALEGQLRELSAEDTEVRSALELHNHSVRTDIPSLKHALSLYVTISNIRWNYRCDGTQVQGYVARERDNDVLPFRFAHGDPVQVADRLWSLIEP
ncbi:hypothetical protein CDCA_CDCA12G3343 [Cyanidium caldarium]|uniref:Kinetochore protein Spc24 n=1 Tax=Cyanidium caldarium TaxID=2771 RepID=A0AAV9IZV8_CYACA|nr:hypothetical protein CDCA_CDCA12G3343 [Cyanidium caldarium]